MVGIIVDASYHTIQGYVTCTTQLGIVSVYGVPYGSVVAGMRIFVRQMGGQATNQAFVYDGMAPNVSSMGSSGSLVYSSPLPGPLTTSLAQTGTTDVPSVSGMASAVGYFWHCFFYLPTLPTTVVTLFQMSAATGGTTLALEYLATGQLRMRSGTGHGYLTSGPIAPHSIHYIQIQPGIAGSELLIDGVASYGSLIGSGDIVTFAGSGMTYQLSLLANRDGSQMCPIGSWISKFGYGTSGTSSSPLLLPDSLPEQDSDLPTSTSASSITALYALLCEDSVGTGVLVNSATSGGATGVGATIVSPPATIAITGPY